MAKIEKISMSYPMNETSNGASPSMSPGNATSGASAPKSVASSAPGLRIRARPTTASLSDYAQFDLRLILNGEHNSVLTNGIVS